MMPLDNAPFKRRVFEKFVARVRTISDSSASLEDRSEAVRLMHCDAGWGENGREALESKALEALVDITVSDWPADGDLAASACPSDWVVEVDFHRRSLRQVAIACLTEMANYRELGVRMIEAGIVDRGLPKMLHDLLTRFEYSESRSKASIEQRLQHCIAERLLNMCANLVCTPQGFRVAEGCGDVILEDYDAFARAREEGKAFAALNLLAGAEGEAEEEEKGGAAHHDGSSDADSCDLDHSGVCDYDLMPTNFCRFWANALRWSDPAEQERLVAKGLVGKLRQVPGGPMSGTMMALGQLETARARHAEREAQQVARELKVVADMGKARRHLGNEAFRAGQYEEAVEQYRQGISHTPQDPLLHSNMSLALLKLERYKEAVDAAQYALHFDPRKPKYWARMGDGLRGLGQNSCALLCYEQAAKLAPQDEEIRQRKEAAEAVVEPGERLDSGSLPRERDVLQGMEWLEQVQDILDDPDRVEKQANKAMRKLLGLDPEGTADWRQTPAGIAISRVAPLMDLAECAATAASLPRGEGEWCVSWTNLAPRLDEVAPMFLLRVKDGRLTRASVLRPGRPTAPVIIQALKLAMTHPENRMSPKERPAWVLVAHRMRAEYAAVEADMRRLGVKCQLETREEAEATAAAHGTDPEGINFRAGDD